MTNKKLHINGIGGKGMAPLAGLAHLMDWSVTGDDLIANHRTQQLTKNGIKIEIGTNTHGTLSSGYLSATSARGDNYSGGKNVKSLARLELVDLLLRSLPKKQICVSGSFGKSTACGLLFQVMKQMNPTLYMGACQSGTLCGAQLGSGKYAIVEACEYRNSFFSLTPTALLHLNTHANHEDFLGLGNGGFQNSLKQLVRQNTGTLKHIVTLCRTAEVAFRGVEGISEVHTVGFGDDSIWRVTASDGESGNCELSVKSNSDRGITLGPVFLGNRP